MALQWGSGHPWFSTRDALLTSGHIWPKGSTCGTAIHSPITPMPPGCSLPRDSLTIGTLDHLVRVAMECCEHDIWLGRAVGGGRSKLEETGKRRSWCRGER